MAVRFLFDILGRLIEEEPRMASPSDDRGPLCIEIAIADDIVESNIDCTICLDPFGMNQRATMLICGHYYHNSCYEEWKWSCIVNEYVISCPICRG